MHGSCTINGADTLTWSTSAGTMLQECYWNLYVGNFDDSFECAIGKFNVVPIRDFLSVEEQKA